VSYRLELARDTGFTEGLLKKEGITSTFTQITGLNPDLGAWYWRVVPVDQYGASPVLNPVRGLLFTGNPSVMGSLSGRVTDAVTHGGLGGVTVKLRQSGLLKATATTDTQGEYFRGNLTPGSYTIEVSKTGYETRNLSATVFENNNAEKDVVLTPSGGGNYRWGELSGDGKTGTVDASMIGQWRVRLIEEFPAYPGVARPLYPDAGDVNGDGALNELDASDILRWKVGLIGKLPRDCDGNGFGPDTGCKNAEEGLVKATRQVSLPVLTGDPGSEVTVEVSLDDASEVRGYFLDITYDATVLEYLDFQNGSLTTSWGAPTANAFAGEVLFSASSATALSGSGTLVALHFRIRSDAAGKTSVLHVVEAELNGTQLPVNALDGSVTVTEPVVEGEGVAEGEGSPEGLPEGEGVAEGTVEGAVEGTAEGEGSVEGSVEGVVDGNPEGLPEGAIEGEGTVEGEGQSEGAPPEGEPEGEPQEGEGEPNPFGCTCLKADGTLLDLRHYLGDLFLAGLGILALLTCAQIMRRP
jgi:hypothetical protein